MVAGRECFVLSEEHKSCFLFAREALDQRDHIATKFIGNSSPIQHKNISTNLMV